MKICECELTFSELKRPAVIVDTGKPWRFIFWAGAQYVGCIDLGRNVWFTPEWLETNSPENHHCYEPIMDKKLKYTWVRVLEEGEARAIVHWHYACCDPRYRVFNGNTTADEYYTVYPDGIAVRKLVAWPGDQSDFGGNPNFWQVAEYILISGIGTTPKENLEEETAFTLMDENGEKIELKWPLPKEKFTPLCAVYPQVADWKTYIGQIHVRGRPKPFLVIPKSNKSIFPFKPCTVCGKDHPQFGLFPGGYSWKHWPATDMENFVLGVDAGDDAGKVATHTSFIDCNYTSILGDRPPRPTTWLFLTGAIIEDSPKSLIKIAKSWLYPAKIETGCESGILGWGLSYGDFLYEGYAYSERAYTFRKFGRDDVEFTMNPLVTVVNPVIIINGWKSQDVKVSINGEPLNPKRYKFHLTNEDLVLWINKEINKYVRFKISAG